MEIRWAEVLLRNPSYDTVTRNVRKVIRNQGRSGVDVCRYLRTVDLDSSSLSAISDTDTPALLKRLASAAFCAASDRTGRPGGSFPARAIDSIS